MDGVPGVTQVKPNPLASMSTNDAFADLSRTVPDPARGQLHLQVLHKRRIWLLLVSLAPSSLLRRCKRGPLMIRPSSSRARPFEQIATSNGDLVNLLQAERDATPVLLTDCTHDLSGVIYSRYFETGAFPFCVDSILANGYGKVECLPKSILQAGVGLGLDTGMPGVSEIVTGNKTVLSTAAMQGMSTNDPNMSMASPMPDMSTNDPMSGSSAEMSTNGPNISMASPMPDTSTNDPVSDPSIRTMMRR